VNAVRWTALVVVLLVITVAVLFTIQNSGRTTDLSLDLWVAAFHLKEAVPLPLLLWSAFGFGLVGGGVVGLRLRSSAMRKVRDLEQQLARASVGGDSGWS